MRGTLPGLTSAGLGLLLGACAASPSAHHAPTSLPPAVVYSRPAPENLRKITVERFVWSADEAQTMANLPRHPTRFGLRWIIEQRPDTMQPPPWTTRLSVLTAPDAREGVRVELRDHASYGVEHAWLNEKLLFLRVWWGRIATTDAVLDVESLRFTYAEDANYFGAVYPQADTRPRE